MKTSKKLTLAIYVSCLMGFVSLTAQRKGAVLGDTPKVIVKRIDGLGEYSSTIDLNDTRKQLLMAGQNYQTNYGIYAAITLGESSLGAEYKTLLEIDFEIVNYKPTYFIGIDSVVVAANPGKDGLTLKIYTRALSDKRTYSLGRDALKDIHFEKGAYLHSQRYLNPMFPQFDIDGKPIVMEDGRLACDPDNGMAFDFEFFYKDGRHVVRKQDYDKENETLQMYKNEIALSLPGRRCWTSFNKIVF
jgi:hypothetical protein